MISKIEKLKNEIYFKTGPSGDKKSATKPPTELIISVFF